MVDKKATVLLVDDDPELIDIFKEGLEDLSFRVLTALNGDSALKILTKEKVDCLITDISMPGMTGVDLVANVRQKFQELPVFFITGYMDYSREALNSFHPKAVIFKPFDIEEAALLIKNHFLRQG